MTASEPGCGVVLHWVPLGAGSRVVPRCGRAYERLSARCQGRPARPLFHAALEVTVDDVCTVVEMTPAWSPHGEDRGVVVHGPVGLRWLGRSRWFRYEVRRWPGGVVPDLAFAAESLQVSADAATARRVLALVPLVPSLTWGRDELGLGDMWNSNSLVAWLLCRGGVDTHTLCPPRGGRAPGWAAGFALAGWEADRLGQRGTFGPAGAGAAARRLGP